MRSEPIRRFAAAVVTLLLAATAWAQENQPQEPNMAVLLDNVNSIASNLQASVANLEQRVSEGLDSMEKGDAVLNEMLSSVKAVHDSMAEDSEVWKELTRLMDLWEQRRKQALEKAETNPAFDQIAKEWDDRLKAANTLRTQILEQRAESEGLMRSIESDRDVVLAYYELGKADQALAALQEVNDNLAAMNENMSAIVAQTQVVSGGVSN